MSRHAIYCCEVCLETFDYRDDIDEHLVDDHNIPDKFVTVHDPVNAETEPEAVR